MFITTR